MSVETSDADWLHLYSPFAAKVHAALAMVNTYALDPATKKPKFPNFSHYATFEGYRSSARQQWLYEQGRTRPGDVVTNTPVPGHHGFGLAADIVWYDVNGQPRWDGEDLIWQYWGHAVRAQGMVWGGNWQSIRDLPHCEPKPLTYLLWRPLAKHYLHTIGLTTP